jgi:hypothetical protein
MSSKNEKFSRFRLVSLLFAVGVVASLLLGSVMDRVMASTLTSRVSIQLTSNLSGTAGITTAAANLLKTFTSDLGNGTSTGNADRVWSENRTIAASGTNSTDLQGSLVDAIGQAFTPLHVKTIAIFPSSTNTNDVVFGNDTNHVPIFSAVTATVAVKPGGAWIWHAPQSGVTVTAATGDILKFTNGGAGTSVTYDVVVIGTST